MSLEHASLHKSTLYLLFSPRCLPYAELATYYQSKTPFRLVMGLDHNLLATESRLVINKGPLSDRKTVLVGKFKICNFLNRLSNPAYCKISSDFIFNLQHHFNQSLIADRLKSRNGPLKLADFLAWDKSLVTLAASAKAFESLDPNLARIKSEIAQKLSTAPPLDICKFDIASKLIDIANADPVVVYNSLTESKEADLALPVPLLKLPGNIKDVAASLANQFQPTKYVSHVNATGVILHFTLNRSWLRKETLKNILNLNQTYGTNSTGLGNIAVIDFSSPNIAKPFHAGHLRSTMLGNFVQHILKANGWTTVGINYLGDWGKQYGLLAVAFEMFGNEEQLVQDPIKHLFDIYVQISNAAKEDPSLQDKAREYFKNMEEGDPHALALWKRFRDLSIVKYKEIYKRLNVHFDVFSGESQYSMKQMTDVVNELEAKGLLEDDEKARIIRLDEYGAGTAVIQKKDGSMLYLSRDLAAAKDRYDTYDFDAQFYVVGLPQSHHFKQLFKIFELCGYQFRDRCVHMAFGSVEGMSSRKGNVVFLEQILDITKEEMHNVMRKNESKYAQIEDPDMVSDLVGMSSIIIQDFSGRSIKDYMFEWSRMLSFEGDTGPYLQYAHARLCSIERGVSFEIELDQIKMEILAEPRCEKLLDLLAMYPDIVREAGIYREPILVVKYVLRVAHAVSSALKDIYVLNQPQEIALTRLAMYKCARIVLGNALSILGLRPLLRM